MKTPNELDATVKVMKTIRSCKTTSQLEVAMSMVVCHRNLYRSPEPLMFFNRLIQEKLRVITI